MSIVARTIGFEAEYERNVVELIRSLNRNGWSQTDHLHDYHCSCPQCHLNPGPQWRFRAQRDATCAGEIITNIIDLDELAITAEALSGAAYQVDAEPGLNAGLHVHVGVAREDVDVRLGMMLVFGLYEQALGLLASGPFRALRGMNRTVAQSLPGYDHYGGPVAPWPEQRIFEHAYLVALSPLSERRNWWDRTWQNWERHANLSPATAHPTMEVRIWNSTRAAWRIEMFTKISHHLASPDVIYALFAQARDWLPTLGAPLVVDDQLHTLTSVLVSEDPTLAEPIDRQITSQRQLADSPDPIQFTLS